MKNFMFMITKFCGYEFTSSFCFKYLDTRSSAVISFSTVTSDQCVDISNALLQKTQMKSTADQSIVKRM